MLSLRQNKTMRISSDFPFKVKKSGFFYGWIILILGTLGVLCSIPGQTMGVSPFTNYLIDSLGLSRGSLSNAYFFGTLSSSLLLTPAGKLWDKNGARVILIATCIILSLSLIIGSFSPELILFFSRFTSKPETVAFIFITLFFFFIRFSGQGVLTLISRNIIMKWFDVRRGLVNGISSSFVALGFSLAPVLLLGFIEAYTWQGAWRVMALIVAAFCVISVVLVRDTPESVGQIPDGKLVKAKRKKASTFQTRKNYSLKEAKKTWALWVYAFTIAFNAFYITGFTFHVQEIFESVGLSTEKAFDLFIPAAIIAIAISITLNILSDYIKLQYLLFVMIIGGLTGAIGLMTLPTDLGYYLIIAGNGIMGGVFTVLIAVAWPRFYGRKYLGEIAGFGATIMVISSAVGPSVFAYSQVLFNSFAPTAYFCIAYLALLFVFAFKASNPQEKVKE